MKFSIGVLIVMTATPALAQYGYGTNSQSHQSQGYVRNNGTYVAPHVQTNPNTTQYDNYSTRGNVNPYTGQQGTRTPRY